MTATSGGEATQDWTGGKAKWAAAGALALCASAGMLWSLLGRVEPAPAVPPARAPVVSESIPTAAPAVVPELARRIDVNTADEKALETLPQIGPALARRIVEYRRLHGPFARLEDLDAVRGVGPKTIERLRPYAVAAPPAVSPGGGGGGN